MVLTVFVRRFLPGTKEATICSTCRRLKVQTDMKQRRQSDTRHVSGGRGGVGLTWRRQWRF